MPGVRAPVVEIAADGSFDHDFALDGFQETARVAVSDGHNVLVAAPTGSGKTVTGEHAIDAALRSGGRAFYTTPIKALSNQKFRDLGEVLGRSRVGLLTGDHVVNAEAPVVVMTTEVLRNMLYAGSDALENLRWVVLDEVHFLQDAYRGAVWEEVLIHTPASVRFACLSATVSNAAELGAWIESLRGPTVVVVEHRRPVELEVLYMVGDRNRDSDHLIPMFVGGEPNPQGFRFDRAGSSRARSDRGRPPGRSRFRPPRRTETVERLESEGLLPVIYFVFSRRGCDQAAARCLTEGVRLTTDAEATRIRELLEGSTAELADGDLGVLGYDHFAEALSRGIAPHHAGMVPAFREAVERCFSEGLVKVVFATETLAVGINMPARSVVIEQLSKYSGDGHAMLTPAQFTQLSGRAGRRGLDDHGAAIVLWSPWVDFSTAATLAASREFPLESSFSPTYNMVANLVERHSEKQARGELGRSFAQFQRDASLVGEHRRLSEAEAIIEQLSAELASLGVSPDDASSLRRADRAEQRVASRIASRAAADRKAIEASISRLAPGDVLDRSSGPSPRPVVVISTSERRRSSRVDAVTPRGKLVRLRSEALEAPLNPVGRIDLPVPHRPDDEEFRRQAATRLRRLDPKPLRRRRGPTDEDSSPEHRRALALLAAHPLNGREERSEILGLADRLSDARRDAERAQRRIHASRGDLVGRFEAVRSVLEGFAHLQGWSLTASGRRLRSIFHESDLLVSLAVEHAVFEDLGAADLASIVSCLTHEHRGGDRPPPPRLPTRELQARFDELRTLWRRISAREEELSLPATREPSAGFSVPARLWCSGADLRSCLDDDLSGGDFVRNARNLVDLLTQIATVSAGETAAAASLAADIMGRDVVLGAGAPR